MNDLKLQGVQTSSGGTYDSVKIDGICTVNGDLDGQRIDVDGVTTFNGNLSGGVFDCDGTTTVNGNLALEGMTCDGVVSVNGTVALGHMECGGVLTISETLRAQTIGINGVVTVRGSRVEADKVVCRGALNVDGELNAEIVDADGFIKAREIVGERVVIQSHTNGFVTLLRWFKPDAGSFDFIEATEVDLRKVRAKVVHGHTVTLGKNCNIETVDCSGTLHIDPSAKVGTITGDYTLV
jgi:hypothetical protein